MSSLSNPVIRRYTPPTCTLEILTPKSALSRWSGRSATTKLQFHLRFDDPRLPEEKRCSVRGDRAQLEALHQAVNFYVQDLLNKSPAQFGAMFSAVQATTDTTSPPPEVVAPLQVNAVQPTPRQISLQPSEGLTHALSLGTLATPETGQVVHLSLLQLFDLATALDEYAAAVVALPNLRRSRFVYPPAWASIAAVLVATVGLATAALQYYSRPGSRQQIATSSSNQSSINNPQQIAVQPTIPPLTSLETLPPPQPPAGSIQPSPGSIPPVPVPNTTSQLPRPTVAKTPPATPVNPSPRATTPQTVAIKPEQPSKVVISPRQAPTGSPKAAPQPNTSPSPIAIPSPLAELNSPPRQSQAANPQPIPTFTFPPTTQAIPAPIQPPLTPTPAPTRSPQRLTTPPKQPQKTAFDTVPQVAEVREYFQRRWEPSSGVKETLEYSLLLDVDGTIQRIEPLGEAASRNVDRTGMPLLGENFVSPSKNGRTPRIRLVLSPDGNVRSFLEPE